MNLFFRESGSGNPLIILHGLFGSSDNWYSLSKVFAAHFRVFTIDQRNHGQSFHSPDHDYKLLTSDLETFVTEHQLSKPVLLGHSMGGKAVMNFAVRNPGMLSSLIVADIMPKKYPLHHDDVLTGLKSIDPAKLSSRNDADGILQQNVADAGVRQFLLKNLSRSDKSGFEWKINLPALDANIAAMAEGMVYEGQFKGPTLFIRGSRSNYYAPGDESTVAKYFPNAQWVTLDAGHWVQAEKPQEFAEAVLNFLGKG